MIYSLPSTLLVVTTIFFNTLNAQTMCSNEAGQGVYDGVCQSCPANTWAVGSMTGPCGPCANNRACNPMDGAATICGYGVYSCDTQGIALSCKTNFVLNDSGGCSACPDGMTSYFNNQIRTCSSDPTAWDDNPQIGCGTGTDLCNNVSGESINCFAGNELIGKACSPCTVNMQRPEDGSIEKCRPCVEGQNSCTPYGAALSCDANWYFDAPSTTCIICPAGLITGDGNQDGACHTAPASLENYCPAGSSLSHGVCAPCKAGTSSQGGVNTVCTGCGFNVKHCDIALGSGLIYLTECRTGWSLINNVCRPILCPANTFIDSNSKCQKCHGTTVNPAGNQILFCQSCRPGEKTCTYTTALTCNPGYVLTSGRCYAEYSYDCLHGYQVIASPTRVVIKQASNLTPPECLHTCWKTKGCRSLYAATNGLDQRGLCTLYGKVLQISDIALSTTIIKVSPRSLPASAAKGPAKNVKATVKKVASKITKVVKAKSTKAQPKTKVAAKIKTSTKAAKITKPKVAAKVKTATKGAKITKPKVAAKVKPATTKGAKATKPKGAAVKPKGKPAPAYSMHFVLNRQSRSSKKSIVGLPASAKVCSSLSGKANCFA